MSFPWNTILNVISFKYNYEYHFRETPPVKYNYRMSFPWNTFLNVISFTYNSECHFREIQSVKNNTECHFREIQSVKYNTECHFREIEFWMSFLLNTILNVITVIYNSDCSLNFQVLNWINNSFINNLYEIF
jgi:hypothetical protein